MNRYNFAVNNDQLDWAFVVLIILIKITSASGNHMPAKLSLTAIAISAILMSGCDQGTSVKNQNIAPSDTQVTATAAVDESTKANQLFEDIFMAGVMRSPTFQSYLGIKKDQDKWDDISDANAQKELQIAKNDLLKVNEIDQSQLDEQTKISLKLMKMELNNNIDDFKWRFHSYPVNQMYGTHSMVPSLLINQHSIAKIEDAQAYISRLNAMSPLFDQLINNLQERADKGIIAPKFVYPYVIADSENIIKGAPFDDGQDSTLLADFNKKVQALKIEDDKKATLIAEATRALKINVKPAYEKLISYLNTLQQAANTDDGAWKLPDGKAFYNNALQRTTTTDLSSDSIHTTGLSEVKRIHGEMHNIMRKVEFSGDQQAFFEFMRTDKQFYYEENEKGQQTYLKGAESLIEEMKANLDRLFMVKPKAQLTVKAVEPFREKSAGKAFYQRPSMDGSRPGIYYANLYSMADMPSYQMAALAYHEAIPGHHMQLAIAQELQGIPKFRKFAGMTAYTEGWGLYAELLPKEIGFYRDPYADFGRLAMELWRACRLVVDTGIHDKGWTREEAISYLQKNTPNAQRDVVKAIERYIVMPSQATAYKIGMLKILELRLKAKEQLKDKFDIREFHNVVLKNGPLPLNVLADFVDKYIADNS
ncbi:MAG: hypothetical protein ACI9FJ_003306 [Alteromonadaceae bacterium]